MGFFVVVIRMPVGLLASAVLLLWSLLVFLVYCVFFVFLAIFGKLAQINERLNPWLHMFNGVKCMPGLWNWVLRPYQGIFEPPQPEAQANGSGDSSALLNRYRAAIAQQSSQPEAGENVQNNPGQTAAYGGTARPGSLSSGVSSSTDQMH